MCSGLDIKTNNRTCVFLTLTTRFFLGGATYLWVSSDFVSQTYTNPRVSVYVYKMLSRPQQRQEIPWDVFNKTEQQLPGNWPMRTC